MKKINHDNMKIKGSGKLKLLFVPLKEKHNPHEEFYTYYKYYKNTTYYYQCQALRNKPLYMLVLVGGIFTKVG